MKRHFLAKSFIFTSLSYISTSESARGIQRLFSVKYLFEEVNIAKNFLLLEDGYKFQDERSIRVQFSNLI